MKIKKFSAAALALALILSVACGAPAFAAAAVKCDTTLPVSLHPGENYTFKVTVSGSNAAPSFTVGNGGVLKTYFAGRNGNNYYFKVVAAGAPGSAAGVYTALPGQKAVRQCVVGIAASAYGSTAGNIANGGRLAQEGDWIYYKNRYNYKSPDDDGTLSELYKMRADGSGKTKLTDDKVEDINVLNGWIYYVNFADHNNLYKIRTDGTGRTKLTGSSTGYSGYSPSLNAVDGWLYYYNDSDDGGLCKIRTDGTGRMKLTGDGATCISVVDGWIYYQNSSDGDNLYKIRTDGTGRTKLTDDSAESLNVADGWIYFYDKFYNASNGSYEGRLYKIRTDGTGRTKLIGDDVIMMNVANGWIYYCNGSDEGKLYKIRTDGTGRTKLTDDQNCYWIHVLDGWIYYDYEVNYDFNRKNHTIDFVRTVCRIRPDGTGRQVLRE